MQDTARENARIKGGIAAFVKTHYTQCAAAFGEVASADNFSALEEAMYALQAMTSSANSDMVTLRRVWTEPAKDIVPTLAKVHRGRVDRLASI